MKKKDITTREIEDRQIAIGMAVKEFMLSEAGRFLLDMWDQKRALTCVEAILGKHQKTEDGHTKGQYKVLTIEDVYLQRGTALGLQIVLDDINSLMNVANRLVKDRKKEEENSKQT